MSFFGSMLGGIAARTILPLMCLAGFGAYKSGALNGMSTTPSHYEMQARVTSVEQSCRLRVRKDGKIRQTEVLSCNRATSLLARPNYSGFTLHKSERIRYSYYSMDGQSTLIGTFSHGHDGNGRTFRQNEVIDIRVDSKNHSNSQVI